MVDFHYCFKHNLQIPSKKEASLTHLLQPVLTQNLAHGYDEVHWKQVASFYRSIVYTFRSWWWVDTTDPFTDPFIFSVHEARMRLIQWMRGTWSIIYFTLKYPRRWPHLIRPYFIPTLSSFWGSRGWNIYISGLVSLSLLCTWQLFLGI